MRRITAIGLSLTLALLTLADGPAHARAEDQVMVRFHEGARDVEILRGLGARQVGTVYGTDVLVVRGPAALASVLDRLPQVDYAEPDGLLRISLDAPNDPRYGTQYSLERIQALGGWTAYPGTYTSSGGPTIAVLDTGIDTRHEDLAGRIDTANSSCFLGLLFCLSGYEDDNGHGTHVSGIAAATTNNGRGIAGVAYDTRIMALKVCDLVGSCSYSAVASAVNWATQRGASVINMSLGGSGSSTTLASAVRNAYAAGVVLVAAAGNNGNATINYPAGYPEVIGVAATDVNDQRASYSQRNETVELSAPGSSVISTYPGGYRSLSGTSMSSPHVAGLAALLKGSNPTWTNAAVRDRMKACADDLGAAGYDTSFGHGRINVSRALGAC